MNIYEKNMSLKSDEELMGIINSDDVTIMQEVLSAAKKEVQKRKLNHSLKIEKELVDGKKQKSIPSNLENDVRKIRQWVTFFGVLAVFSLMLSLFYLLSVVL
jgi:hypothetical protein